MDLENTKQRYDYANWPASSKVRYNSDSLFIVDTNGFTGYEIQERNHVGIENSYEDIYVNKADSQDRVSLTVLNFDDYEQAKEYVIEHLDYCANDTVPRLNCADGSTDISFGGVDEDSGSVILVRGNTVISVRCVGEVLGDFRVFTEKLSIPGLF